MKLIDTILLLATVVFGVSIPLFVGHALAAHEPRWFLYAGIDLAVAAVLSFVLSRRLRPESDGAAAH